MYMNTPHGELMNVVHVVFGAEWKVLWFLFIPRINLSPFTKDFRGEEHYNESIDYFLSPAHAG